VAVEAVRRLLQPEPVAGGWVMVVALIGLAVNLIVLKLLHGGEQTLNTRGAILHVLGDLLGSVAALAAGAVVYFTGWLPIDPILSLVISLLILVSTARLVLDVTHVLMEGVPRHLDLAEIGRTIAAVPGVVEVHDLHVWSLSSRQEALTAHVRVESLEAWQDVLRAIEVRMAEEFGIRHLTLQPEPVYDIHTVPASVLADQLAGSQSGKP
ncbi:MAG: cation diffusion facilitator family transporter, partial [Gammaproteobacteria bacterium]